MGFKQDGWWSYFYFRITIYREKGLEESRMGLERLVKKIMEIKYGDLHKQCRKKKERMKLIDQRNI